MTDAARYVPLRFLLRDVDQRTGSSELPLLAVTLSAGVLRRDAISADEPRADDLSGYKRCQRGDIVVNRMRAFQGALGVAPEDGLVSPDYAVLRATSDADPEFISYALSSSWGASQMAARIRGIGGTANGAVRTPRVNFKDIGSIRLWLPPLQVQQQISRFIREERAAIDALLAAERAALVKLDEYRAALITAEMNPEGVSSSAPADMRLRHVADLNPPVAGLRQVVGHEVSFLPLERVWHDHRFDPSQTIVFDGDPKSYNVLAEGDLLVPKVSPTFAHGRTALARNLVNGYGLATSEVFVVRARAAQDSRFLQYRLRAADFLAAGQGSWEGVAGLKRVSADFVRNVRINAAAWERRFEIVDALDRRDAELSPLIERFERMVARLGEYRAATTTEIVTGALDVTAATASLTETRVRAALEGVGA